MEREIMIERRRITITYFEYLVVQRKCLIKRYSGCYILRGIGEELGRYVVVDRDRRSMWFPSQASVSDCERLIDEVYGEQELEKPQYPFIGLLFLVFLLVVLAWSIKS